MGTRVFVWGHAGFLLVSAGIGGMCGEKYFNIFVENRSERENSRRLGGII